MLIQQIRDQVKKAMFAKREIERDVLRFALGEIQSAEARSSEPLSEEAQIKIIRKLIKSNQETIEANPNEEVKGKLVIENDVLGALLPSTLSVEEIVKHLEGEQAAIKAANSDGQATGVAMKALKKTKVLVEGKDVAAAVKQIRAG